MRTASARFKRSNMQASRCRSSPSAPLVPPQGPAEPSLAARTSISYYSPTRSQYRPRFQSGTTIKKKELPKDDSPEEVEKARQKSLSDYPGYIMSNTWWADPVFLGQYPAWAKEKFGDQLYTMTPEEWALVSQPLDFYAYNCYQGTVDIVPDPSKYDAYAYQGSPQTAAAWNITPKVLYHASKFWFERYHLPILITENGYSGLDCVMLDGEVHDPQRIDFLHRYLLEVARAMADGIPVIGYSVWSLFDNFEWAAGYSCRYGLIYVDYPTQQRIVKDSGWWYRDVIASNGANL